MKTAIALLLAASPALSQPDYRESRVNPPPDQIPTYEILRTSAGID